MRTLIIVVSLVTALFLQADELSDLRKENEALKRELAALQQQIQGEKPQSTLTPQDRKAGLRAKYEEERKTYSQEQLREIEQLYQSANKDLKNPAAKEILNTLIEKYPQANRTGCAVQYMGQISTGEEKEKYLRMAIKDFGDCYYGSGVQVGAYARLYLAYYYREIGRNKESEELFDEIRKDYPHAVNHKGKLLINMLPK